MCGKLIEAVLIMVRAIRIVVLLLVAGVILLTLVTGTFESTLQSLIRPVGFTGFVIICFVLFILIYPAIDIGGTVSNYDRDESTNISSSSDSSYRIPSISDQQKAREDEEKRNPTWGGGSGPP